MAVSSAKLIMVPEDSKYHLTMSRCSKCTSKARLDGKTAVITGANTGIGKCTAQDFYTRGARVIVACRNLEKTNQAVADIKEAYKDLENLGTIQVVELDLSSLKSIRNCAKGLLENENRIDLLINNAGVMSCPESKTEDGFEMQMGTNHLGHFLFTLLLLPRICQSTPARIVNVSSTVHDGNRIDLEDLNWEKKKYSPFRSYKQSKLANILFTKELARRLKEKGISGVNTYSLHPGAINTELARHLADLSWYWNWFHWTVSWFFKTPEQGSQTTIHCAVDEKCADETGLYYAECAEKKPSKSALNEEDARGLWDLSWSMGNAECTSKARLDGKTAVITGANTGIGKCTAQDFYTRGARVIVACRNLEKANQAVADIKEACKDLKNLGTILVVELDLSSFQSIRNCAKRLLETENKIDLLINNAGVMMCPESKTEDGFEMQIGTNHLGHFLFTLLLLPRICQSTPARIVNVSSTGHDSARIDLEDLNWEKKKYSAFGAYRQSKLANILFAKELTRRLKEKGISGVTTYSLHPGAINTELARHIPDSSFMFNLLVRSLSWSFKSPPQGAQTTIYCAVDEKCSNETGLYYAECAVKKPSKSALYEEDARGLWDLSWKMVGLDDDYDPFVKS